MKNIHLIILIKIIYLDITFLPIQNLRHEFEGDTVNFTFFIRIRALARNIVLDYPFNFVICTCKKRKLILCTRFNVIFRIEWLENNGIRADGLSGPRKYRSIQATCLQSIVRLVRYFRAILYEI